MPFDKLKTREFQLNERALIVTGGAALAGLAGYVNVLVLGFFHVPVSHMSGAASRIGIALVTRNFSDLRVVVEIIGAFFIGAACSGYIIGRSELKPGRHYGLVLCLEGIVLALAAALLERGNEIGVPIASMACGLQNAMASSYYGLVIRTTHVTGIVTDLGVMLGHWLKGHGVKRWKAILLSTVFFGFLTGGIVGAALFASFGFKALWFAAFGCFFFGAAYAFWFHLLALPD